MTGDGFEIGPGQFWRPDDGPGPDRLAAEAGVRLFSEVADLRQMEVALADVTGPWDLLLEAEMTRNDLLRRRAQRTHGDLPGVDAWGLVAASDERARRLAQLAGFDL